MAPKNKNKNKNKNTSGKKAPTRKRTRTKEIVFDPEARRDYLRGFSERKRQRRAYGLAMQKVKDRKAKLEARKELKEAELDRIEEAEKLKEQAEEAAAAAKKEGDNEEDNNAPEDNDSDNEKDSSQGDKITTTYHDKATQQKWGGDVVVTTSMNLLDSDDEAEKKEETKKPLARQPKKKSHDAQQEYAGNVEKFLSQLKQKMPGKKKATQSNKHRGKHGAAAMKGIGGAAVMKIAQKALSRSKSKGKR